MPDSNPPSERKNKILSLLLIIVMFGSYFYSIFMPLKLGTVWFPIGLVVYLVGLVLIAITMINFATTPMNEPVTKGIYRYSRNPMFIGWFLLYFGIAIACISWLYVLIIVFFIFIMSYLSPYEEAMTLDHYGKPYKDYMERTPKWIGIPKR
jgi:protein-S-isoprenylcysteine O-methyltransferase Ste14